MGHGTNKLSEASRKSLVRIVTVAAHILREHVGETTLRRGVGVPVLCPENTVNPERKHTEGEQTQRPNRKQSRADGRLHTQSQPKIFCKIEIYKYKGRGK